MQHDTRTNWLGHSQENYTNPSNSIKFLLNLKSYPSLDGWHPRLVNHSPLLVYSTSAGFLYSMFSGTDCSFSPSSESLGSKTTRTVYRVSQSGTREIFDANRKSSYVSSFTWNQQGRGLGSLLLATSYCEDELHVLHTPGVLHYWVLWTMRTLNYSVKVDDLAYVILRVKINSQERLYCVLSRVQRTENCVPPCIHGRSIHLSHLAKSKSSAVKKTTATGNKVINV